MHYHKLGYPFERHGGSGGSDTLLNGPDEALNAFSPLTPGAGLSDTKGPGKLILGNIVGYKRFAASIQENMSKRIKKMNPETQLLSTGLSEQSP